MLIKISVADALGVITICLVAVLILLGLFCILYTLYFHLRTRGQGFLQLGYFSGPWIVRIFFVLFAIWWGVGEIVRLSFLRQRGKLLYTLGSKWQDTVCKCYIVSNLGFAEPCLFLTLAFLLRASLQKSGPLSPMWNRRTAGFVLLYCLPLSALQLAFILIGPKFKKESSKLSVYLTSTATKRTSGNSDVSLCTYPLFSTIVLGLFAIVLTSYLLLLGRRVLHLVINKGLQKRVSTLILSVSGFFPLRVLFLGLSVLSKPDKAVFEVFAFLAFLSLLCCAGVGICLLVYFPVADSLALRNLQKDIEEGRRRGGGEQQQQQQHNDDTVSLITNQSPLDDGGSSSPPSSAGGGNSGTSTKRGSISFRAMERGETSGGGVFVELSLFSPSQHSTPPGSPRLGWPMLPPLSQGHKP